MNASKGNEKQRKVLEAWGHFHRLSLFALAFAFLSLPSAAADASWASAQKLYDAGDFSAAADAYQGLLATDPGSAALNYDLGDCLYREGKLGPAVASFLRAYKAAPRDGDIAYNLNLALQKAGESLVPDGTPPFVFQLFHGLSRAELAGLFWVLWWAALLLLTLHLVLSRRASRACLKPGLACLALAGIAGLWWLARVQSAPRDPGVIVQADAQIRSGPGENFSVGFTAPAGRRVTILDHKHGWVEVGVLKEGAEGWLPSDAVERL
jgi:tetratricopeptide (TPR) repeat protein